MFKIRIRLLHVQWHLVLLAACKTGGMSLVFGRNLSGNRCGRQLQRRQDGRLNLCQIEFARIAILLNRFGAGQSGNGPECTRSYLVGPGEASNVSFMFIGTLRRQWQSICASWAAAGSESNNATITVLSYSLWPWIFGCLLYTSPSPRDLSTSRMPSSA